jgi:ferrous-iron efflux pump FieF
MSPTPEQLMRRAGRISLATAAILIGLKGGAAWITGSLALIGTLVDSGLDLLVSMMSLLAIEAALQPADKEHRFGHGKAEGVAGLIQAMVVSLSAVGVGVYSAIHIVNPHPIETGTVGVGVLLISMTMTWALVRYQRYVVAETGSLAVQSDSMHYASDFVMDLGVLIAIVAATWGGVERADPICGLLVAGWVMKSAIEIGRNALDMLLDRELEDDERDAVLAIIRSHAAVKGVHDLRTHRSGRSPRFQFHLELDANLTLGQAHVISDEVEALIIAEFSLAQVLIHLDPDDIPHDEPVLH